MKTLHEAVMQQALEALVESARLLGSTDAKRGFGVYTQDDSRFESAMYESIHKHKKTLIDALAQQGEPATGFTDAQFDQVLSERDRYHEVADDLAAQIAAITGEDIGEHSSMNDPWRNAMLAADEFIALQIRTMLAAAPAPQAQQPRDCSTCKNCTQNGGISSFDSDCFECRQYYADKFEPRA